jgi:hypothetical protein
MLKLDNMKKEAVWKFTNLLTVIHFERHHRILPTSYMLQKCFLQTKHSIRLVVPTQLSRQSTALEIHQTMKLYRKSVECIYQQIVSNVDSP